VAAISLAVQGGAVGEDAVEIEQHDVEMIVVKRQKGHKTPSTMCDEQPALSNTDEILSFL